MRDTPSAKERKQAFDAQRTGDYFRPSCEALIYSDALFGEAENSHSGGATSIGPFYSFRQRHGHFSRLQGKGTHSASCGQPRRTTTTKQSYTASIATSRLMFTTNILSTTSAFRILASSTSRRSSSSREQLQPSRHQVRRPQTTPKRTTPTT